MLELQIAKSLIGLACLVQNPNSQEVQNPFNLSEARLEILRKVESPCTLYIEQPAADKFEYSFTNDDAKPHFDFEKDEFDELVIDRVLEDISIMAGGQPTVCGAKMDPDSSFEDIITDRIPNDIQILAGGQPTMSGASISDSQFFDELIADRDIKDIIVMAGGQPTMSGAGLR